MINLADTKSRGGILTRGVTALHLYRPPCPFPLSLLPLLPRALGVSLTTVFEMQPPASVATGSPAITLVIRSAMRRWGRGRGAETIAASSEFKIRQLAPHACETRVTRLRSSLCHPRHLALLSLREISRVC